MRKVSIYNFRKNNIPLAAKNKIAIVTTSYAYNQGYVGILSSQLCATIILYALINSTNWVLLSWYFIFSTLTVIRAILIKIYFQLAKTKINNRRWRKLFILTAALSGTLWGTMGILIFSQATYTQQFLCILILAGVTSGSVSFLSAILPAAIIFLITSILPFLTVIFFMQHDVLLIFDLALFIYLLFLIALAVNTNRMLINILYLQYTNEEILEELMIKNKQLETLATHDPLTKLDNIRLFYLNINNALKRAIRNNQLLALFVIDIDNFKTINDTYGHQVGDKILILVAEKLKKLLRSSDYIARIGGDEFTVILEQMSDKQDIANVANKICHTLAANNVIDNIEINMSTSIGISVYPSNCNDIDTLVKAADSALYYVKNHGRNNFHFSTRIPTNS